MKSVREKICDYNPWVVVAIVTYYAMALVKSVKYFVGLSPTSFRLLGQAFKVMIEIQNRNKAMKRGEN